MGVYHLAPIGTSPGAVTAALAYLKRHQDEPRFKVRGAIVEAVVLFPSWEVRQGEERTPEVCILNDNGQENKRQEWKRGAAVLDIIRDFVKEEFGDDVILYCCPVASAEYDDCFDKIAKATLRFSGGVGKHLWANLTGGPNIVNAALHEVAFLSGAIARLYYTFLADVRQFGKYLRPPSQKADVFDWREVSMVKTNFDDTYYEVARTLAAHDDWLDDAQLLSRLAGKNPNSFGGNSMNLATLRDKFLNKMDGRELEREMVPGEKRTHRNRLSPYGQRIVERLGSELFETLIYPGRRAKETIDRATADLELEKI